ncbi:hypothetical protein FE697_020065 [Mumia zhuanghuii]|uniref:Secreted protein n=2 Tax=Mumia TaxID=1546255 RepID=A0ABW1QJ58_9ACTN|nr:MULTISPECIES: hypothetical protein [Mumia]KAA1418140.1 hypothetical protein FE697_020065 [Mumia zhuanghuii]
MIRRVACGVVILCVSVFMSACSAEQGRSDATGTPKPELLVAGDGGWTNLGFNAAGTRTASIWVSTVCLSTPGGVRIDGAEALKVSGDLSIADVTVFAPRDGVTPLKILDTSLPDAEPFRGRDEVTRECSQGVENVAVELHKGEAKAASLEGIRLRYTAENGGKGSLVLPVAVAMCESNDPNTSCTTGS